MDKVHNSNRYNNSILPHFTVLYTIDETISTVFCFCFCFCFCLRFCFSFSRVISLFLILCVLFCCRCYCYCCVFFVLAKPSSSTNERVIAPGNCGNVTVVYTFGFYEELAGRVDKNQKWRRSFKHAYACCNHFYKLSEFPGFQKRYLSSRSIRSGEECSETNSPEYGDQNGLNP